MACGFSQALQAMSNGSAVRSGVGALWVGAMSATISALSLVLVAVVIYRLPLPDTSLITAQGLKVVFGGMTGAFIVTGLAFVAPRLGPTQTFILYSPSSRLRWSACCPPALASRSPAPRARCVRIYSVIARSAATRRSRGPWGARRSPGLLRFARNDDRGSTHMQLTLKADDRVRVPAPRKRRPTDLAANRPLLDHATRFTLRYLCP
jgi:hypothetical protein